MYQQRENGGYGKANCSKAGGQNKRKIYSHETFVCRLVVLVCVCRMKSGENEKVYKSGVGVYRYVAIFCDTRSQICDKAVCNEVQKSATFHENCSRLPDFCDRQDFYAHPCKCEEGLSDMLERNPSQNCSTCKQVCS